MHIIFSFRLIFVCTKLSHRSVKIALYYIGLKWAGESEMEATGCCDVHKSRLGDDTSWGENLIWECVDEIFLIPP